jgi:hypothetical protein
MTFEEAFKDELAKVSGIHPDVVKRIIETFKNEGVVPGTWRKTKGGLLAPKQEGEKAKKKAKMGFTSTK